MTTLSISEFKKLQKSNVKDYSLFLTIVKQQLNIEMKQELVFAPPRKWKFDFYIPEYKIAIEVEGGAFQETWYKDKKTGETKKHTGGRHNTPEGFIEDMEKYNTAVTLGWRLLRFTPEQLYNIKTLETIKKLIL